MMLSRKQKIAILEHYDMGKHLCCKDGMRFLRSIMPKKKAERVNEWAYNTLSCKYPEKEYYRTRLLEALATLW
jgi:hypothetical protein